MRRAQLPPRHLADLDLAGRRAAVAQLGEREFRATQLSPHYFGRLVRDPAAMTDMPAAARDRLTAELLPPLLTPVRELSCDEGATRKTLWRLHDGSLVESVLMGYPDRVTVCVTSQAGCGMACPFCATGQAGLTRNLSTAEIVDQVVWFAGRCRGRDGATTRRRGCPGSCSWAWASRWPTTTAGDRRRSAGSPLRRLRVSACHSGTSPSPPSGWCRQCAVLPRRTLGDSCAFAACAR